MKPFLPILSCLALSLPQLAVAQNQPWLADEPDASPDGALVGAWTQFVPGNNTSRLQAPTIELRFVVQTSKATKKSDSAYCEDYAIAFMTSDGSQGVDSKFSARTNFDKTNFPIAVCSKTLPADWYNIKLIKSGGAVTDAAEPIWFENTPTNLTANLPGPYRLGRRHKSGANPVLRSVTLGDTGCRGAGDGQDCNASWPLSTISKSAVQQNPDLVLHVGDYRYYYEGSSPDTWSYWLKDFVAPTQNLLIKAPWALSRGNHEQCSTNWYGKGFSYLFGPTDNACNYLADPTWHFDVAPNGFNASVGAREAHRYVMIDSSNERSRQLDSRFADALKVSDQESTWWITHIPPINMLYYRHRVHTDTQGVYDSFAKAIDNTGITLCDSTRSGVPHCRPSTVLLGHNHMYQTLKFTGGTSNFTWPQMYIVGHGGVKLRSAGVPDYCDYTFDLPDGSTQKAAVITRKDFGFVTWERSTTTTSNPSGWADTPRDKNGNPWNSTIITTNTCHTKKKSETTKETAAVEEQDKPWWKFWGE